MKEIHLFWTENDKKMKVKRQRKETLIYYILMPRCIGTLLGVALLSCSRTSSEALLGIGLVSRSCLLAPGIKTCPKGKIGAQEVHYTRAIDG